MQNQNISGLTQEEVDALTEQGLVNRTDQSITRTYRQILRGNCLTFFNFLNVTLFVLVATAGSFRNALFMGNVFINTAIGIVQEIRAKRIIDKLSIMTQSKATVLREGVYSTIPHEELVLGDVMRLSAGSQVPADARVVEGSLEVNESLLTGESDTLEKHLGDELYSGSFITSGSALCQVIRVGNDCYASKITNQAKVYKRHPSELRSSIDTILKIVSVIIIPLGIMLFYKSYAVAGDSYREAVVGTVAGVLGMIPEGLVLLTSVTLTVGSIALARKQTLVQELFCIETLARVDMICLDKTGTITSGKMELTQILPCPREVKPPILRSSSERARTIYGDLFAYQAEEREIDALETTPGILGLLGEQSTEPPLQGEAEEILGNLLRVLKDENATITALRSAIALKESMELVHLIPFSSERKYSGASFKGEGTYLMGAAGFLFPSGQQALKKRCQEYAREGMRVLVLARSPFVAMDNDRPPQLEPLALLLLTDVIRDNAKETISYFYEQEVDLKVISGDDPVTVSAIAQKVGIWGADSFVDASTLKSQAQLARAVEQYTVFGRVTPRQKKQMVGLLKKKGHTVAMTGDGVNDVLAMKEADCSIAMAEGSDAAKNVSTIVLLNSDFTSLPAAVCQGRRVINNIQTAASMFLIKTLFSVMLTLVTIFWGDHYPFQPIQMTLIGACAVGIPTFLLSHEPNYERIEPGFLRHVFQNALPAALAITGCVGVIMVSCEFFYHSNFMMGTACFLVTGWNYMAALQTVYYPLNWLRTLVIYGMQVIFFGAAVLFRKLLGLTSLEFGMIILVFMLMTFSPLLIRITNRFLRSLYSRSLRNTPNSRWRRIILREPPLEGQALEAGEK